VSIDVKERYLVPIQFITYSDKIWYDVVTIDVGHIILGRSWLYDLDVTIFGHSNFCSFVYNGKKVKLVSMRLAPLPHTKRPDASSSKKALNLKSLNREIAKKSTIFNLIAREVTNNS